MTARERRAVRSGASLLAAALTGLFAPSCAVPNSFACTQDSQCGVGQCIAGGCAFPSDDCLSGFIYGALSPEQLAGMCVGVDTGVADHSGSGEDDTTSDTSESSSSTDSSTSESESSESESGDTEPATDDTETTDTTDTSDTGTTGELPDTAIAHYSFDEIALPLILDSSGNDYHAEMDNFQSSAAAVVGDGLSFNNLDRVIVPLEVLSGRVAFTIEFYMLVSQPTAARQFLVYYGHETDTASTPTLTVHVEYQFAPTKTSRVQWSHGNNVYTYLIGTTTMNEGEWHHIAVTFSDAGMRLYVDHFLDDEDPFHPGFLSPNLGWIQIGGLPSGFGSFIGIIDELRFSEGALTPDQMQAVP